MANLTWNLLVVTGSEDDIDKFEQEAKQEDKSEGNWRDMLSLKLIEQENRLGLKNWGISDELFLCDEVEHVKEAGKLVYKFDTKWLPPINWLKVASEKFPNLNFDLHFYQSLGGSDYDDNSVVINYSKGLHGDDCTVVMFGKESGRKLYSELNY